MVTDEILKSISTSMEGVVLADVGLHIPVFRATERSFQLLTQVAGRAGRSDKHGEVIVQTYNPEHSALRHTQTHDYNALFQEEIAIRKQFKYPPFSRIIKLTFKHPEQKKCTTEAVRIEHELKQLTNDHDIACAPALITRKHNTYRWHVYIQGPDPQHLLKKLLEKTLLKDGWIINVDPVVMS